MTAAPPSLVIEGLTVAVGPRSRPRTVVEDLSFTVGRGETVCIVDRSTLPAGLESQLVALH